MQGKTVRYVTPGDEFKHELFADIMRCQAADKRKLAEGLRSRAAEDGEEVDTSALDREAEEKEAEGKRHRDSARMIRQHFRGERSRAERSRVNVPARAKARARGAGRPKAQSTRSSARSGDSGSDSESSDTSAPARRRLCAFCGKRIPASRSPRATHCSDRHADRDRQRRKRARDGARSKLPSAPTTADYRRMVQLSDEDRARLWELAVCRCNGHHLELEPGVCTKCGHWLPAEIADGAKRYAAFARGGRLDRAWHLTRAEVAS
jgi:hypothetical protein